MLAIDYFGLGQDTTATAPAPTALTTTPPQNIVMPAIPDNAVLRCKYDTTINTYRCAPVSMFEPPAVIMIGAAAIALLGLGYILGQARLLPRLLEAVVAHPGEAGTAARAIRAFKRK